MSKQVYKVDLKYQFNDMLSKATMTKRTLTEVVLDAERTSERAFNTVGFIDSQIEQLYHTRKAFNDGAELGFATNGYVAIDANIRRPLFNAYATKFMPMITGGGALEVDKGFIMNLTTTEGRLASGSNNKINLVDANVESIQVPIVPIQLGLFLGQIDVMKADQIGYDKFGALEEAIRYSYQIELDKFAFVGDKVGSTVTIPGLLNQTGVATNATQNLEKATTAELVKMFGDEIAKQAEGVLYEADKTVNRIVIWNSLMVKLAQPAYLTESGTVYKSHLEYLTSALNAIKQAYGGGEISIDALPYLEPSSVTTFKFDPVLRENGAANLGRVVFYRQDANVLRMRLALPLTGGALVYDATNNGWRRNFVAFVGYPMSFYPVVRYLDNIAYVPPTEG